MESYDTGKDPSEVPGICMEGMYFYNIFKVDFIISPKGFQLTDYLTIFKINSDLSKYT